MALSADQLYLLESLTYMDYGKGDNKGSGGLISSNPELYKGQTIGEIIEHVYNNRDMYAGNEYGPTVADIETIHDKIMADPVVREMTIATSTKLETPVIKTEMHGPVPVKVQQDIPGAGCFVAVSKDGSEAAVVFEGTDGLQEWKDDFEPAYKEGLSPTQKAALEWYQSAEVQDAIKDCDSVNATGHSKGGNNAKILTILGDQSVDGLATDGSSCRGVDNCVSFDGQGFSDDIMYRYKDLIATRQDRIKTYAAENDFVNILLNDVGEVIYIIGRDVEGNYFKNHDLFTMDPNGSLDDPGRRAEHRGEIPEFLNKLVNSYIRSDAAHKEAVFKALPEIISQADKMTMDDWKKMLSDPETAMGFGELLQYSIKFGMDESMAAKLAVIGFALSPGALIDIMTLLSSGLVLAEVLVLYKLGPEWFGILNMMLAGFTGGAFVQVSQDKEDRVVESAFSYTGAEIICVNGEKLDEYANDLKDACELLQEAAKGATEAAAICAEQQMRLTITAVFRPFSFIRGSIETGVGPAIALTVASSQLNAIAQQVNTLSERVIAVKQRFEETENKLKQ